MGLKQIVIEVEEDAEDLVEHIIETAKDFGGEIVHAILTAGQLFTAQFLQGEVGTAVMNTIELLEETGKSGGEKFKELVTKEGPVLLHAIEHAGGIKGLFASAENAFDTVFNTAVAAFKSK